MRIDNTVSNPAFANWGTKPSLFAQQDLAIAPDPKQTLVLDSDARFGILNCSRQWGKSTVCAVKALHHMLTEPESLVLVISPSERQSREFLRKAKQLVRKIGLVVRGDGDNKVSLMLPDGSRMIGLPNNEDTVRGFSGVDLLLVDEAAMVSDDLYTTVRPMLAVSRGSIWLLSTPKGPRGFFYDTWLNGGPEWLRIAVPATECPRIPAEFLEKEKARGMKRFREEYMCEFISTEEALFDEALLRSLIRHDIPPLMERLRTRLV